MRVLVRCYPREDVSRLDNVVRAVQGTLAASSALPELVGDTGSLQPVQYFVSQETYAELDKAVGGGLELDSSRVGRKVSMVMLGKRADALLEVLLPQALGSLPILWSATQAHVAPTNAPKAAYLSRLKQCATRHAARVTV